jgi:hypothetical protein
MIRGRLPVVVNRRNVAEVAFNSGSAGAPIFIHHGDLTWNLTLPEAVALASTLLEGVSGALRKGGPAK